MTKKRPWWEILLCAIGLHSDAVWTSVEWNPHDPDYKMTEWHKHCLSCERNKLVGKTRSPMKPKGPGQSNVDWFNQ